jgi:hypothetical protein
MLLPCRHPATSGAIPRARLRGAARLDTFGADRGVRKPSHQTRASSDPMKFIVLIYIDQSLMDSLPAGKADGMLRDCFAHTDELQSDGRLLESQMLAEAKTARSLRFRNGKMTTIDGPFAETKELLGGFNLIEANDMDEAMRIAAEFPWSGIGCVEVRAVQDLDVVRMSVGAPRMAEAGGAVAASA